MNIANMVNCSKPLRPMVRNGNTTITPAHQLIKTTNPYQHSTEYHSDELGRLLHYTDALNHTTRYQYSTRA